MTDDQQPPEQASTPSTVLGKRPRPSEDGQSDSPRLFRCGDCNKSYTRVDHLARHVRQHTQERPYVCTVCTKSFARADLLRRHTSIHRDARNTNPAAAKLADRNPRVVKACQACAVVHVKCNNEKPCSRCRTKNIDCRYGNDGAHETEAVARDLLNLAQGHGGALPPSMDYGSMSMSTYPPAVAQQTTGDSNRLSNGGAASIGVVQAPSVPADLHQVHFATPQRPMMSQMPTVPIGVDVENIRRQQPGDWMLGGLAPMVPEYSDVSGHDLRDFLMQVMGNDNPLQTRVGDSFSGTRTPWNLFDMSVDNNLELNDLDLDLLQDYNQHNPFAKEFSGLGPVSIPTVSVNSPADHPTGDSSSQRDSTWRYRPVAKDNIVNNLSIPADMPEKSFGTVQSVSAEPVTHAVRDKILAMMVSVALDEKVIQSFPSTALLDSLLQHFLAHSPMGATLFHAATFRPSQKKPMLVAAMIAAGAVIAPDASLRKFGLALHEAARVTMANSVEKDNSVTRDLLTHQTFLLTLDLGLWSGNSRKMEIAECFLSPLTTMVRRSGCFARTQEAIVPSADDTDDVLADKWRKWIDEESRRRLVFELFKHDTCASIALFINVNISYAELALSVPQHRHLWRASTAHKWRDLYLLHRSKSTLPVGSRPSVIDLLQNLDQFAPHTIDFDHALAGQALMCAAWGLIRDYRQQCVITRPTANQWSSGNLLLSSRLTELRRLLQCLQMGMDDKKKANADLVDLEILSMHLQMSLEQVHRFAGIDGPEEAKRVYPDLREWIRTAGARQAISHAGAILMHASQLPHIRGFTAVAVYQAALALWSYGIVVNATPLPSAQDSSLEDQRNGSDGDKVFLNCTETHAIQRFVAMNRGEAAIQVFADVGGLVKDGTSAMQLEHIPVSQPARVMEAIMNILKNSYRVPGAKPRLVENLLELIDELRIAASTE